MARKRTVKKAKTRKVLTEEEKLDRRRLRARRRSSVIPPLSNKDVEINEIVSRSSYGKFAGQQGGVVLIDMVLLAGFADPDEMAYSEESTRHQIGSFKKSHPDEIAEEDQVELTGDGIITRSLDFRDHMDAEGCRCLNHEQCQICCTQKDLMGIPNDLLVVVNRRFGFQTEEFDVVMDIETAEKFGLI